MSTTRAIAMMNLWKTLCQTESLTYRPSGGAAVVIDALVSRKPPETFQSGAAPIIHVTVLNDSSLGISTATLKPGVDGLDVAEKLGGTPVTRIIAETVSQDPEFVEVLCR
jgi:hypothetical protein